MDLTEILETLSQGKISVTKAQKLLSLYSIEKIEDFAKIDTGRKIRNGVPEVIFAERKQLSEIKKIIGIVENFLRVNKQVCYGGTAINNILPLEDQFYDKSFELPDYDFFSKTPLRYLFVVTQSKIKCSSDSSTFKFFSL